MQNVVMAQHAQLARMISLILLQKAIVCAMAVITPLLMKSQVNAGVQKEVI